MTSYDCLTATAATTAGDFSDEFESYLLDEQLPEDLSSSLSVDGHDEHEEMEDYRKHCLCKYKFSLFSAQ